MTKPANATACYLHMPWTEPSDFDPAFTDPRLIASHHAENAKALERWSQQLVNNCLCNCGGG